MLTEYYGVTGDNFHETVLKVPAYQNASAPSDFGHRYISEEIPTQMVPSASIGRQLDLETPVMDATTQLAGAVAGEDYARTGWTAAKLGLDKLDLADILSLLETGKA